MSDNSALAILNEIAYDFSLVPSAKAQKQSASVYHAIEILRSALADAERERDEATSQVAMLIHALMNIRDIPDQQTYVGIIRRCAQGAIDTLPASATALLERDRK